MKTLSPPALEQESTSVDAPLILQTSDPMLTNSSDFPRQEEQKAASTSRVGPSLSAIENLANQRGIDRRSNMQRTMKTQNHLMQSMSSDTKGAPESYDLD